MPCLMPHLINLIRSALHFKTYPNVYYSTGQQSFYIYCPRKGSKDFTSENIKVFKDWDFSKRRKFVYGTSRQRVLAALRRSVYLTLVSSKKDLYEYRFNNSEEISSKRKASKQKQKSGYSSDGESMLPSSPELPLSPFDGFSNHSLLDSSHQEMEFGQLPMFSTEVPDLNLSAFPNGSFVPVPSNENISFLANAFLETSGNQFNNSCSQHSAMQSLYSVEIIDLGAEQLTPVGVENCSSLMETYAESVIAAEESTFTPYEFKQLSLDDELADVTSGVPMNEDYSDILQTSVCSGVEETVSLKSIEDVVTGATFQSNYGAPIGPLIGDAVQLKIDEVVTSKGDVTAYLISAQKVFGIPNSDSLNEQLALLDGSALLHCMQVDTLSLEQRHC